MQAKMVEDLGIARSARELAERFAARHPSLKRRIMGLPPVYPNPREARIVVDLATRRRTVEKISPPPRVVAFKPLPPPSPLIVPPGVAPSKAQGVKAEAIIRAVAALAGLSVATLRSPARSRHISWPRQHAMLLLKTEARLSMSAIGKLLGNRDHTTAMHGICKASERIQNDRAEYLFHKTVCHEVGIALGYKVRPSGLAAPEDRPLLAEIVAAVAEVAGMSVERMTSRFQTVEERRAFVVACQMCRDISPYSTKSAVLIALNRSTNGHASRSFQQALDRLQEPWFVALYEKAKSRIHKEWPALVPAFKEAA